MKKILYSSCLVLSAHAMEQERVLPLGVTPQSSSVEIAGKIADVIVNMDNQNDIDNAEFKRLVYYFFKKESLTIEASITPHLKERLRESDSEISEILEKDDKTKLENFIDDLISSSLEDALREKDIRFDDLRELANSKERKAKYTLLIAIISGVASVAATFFGVYFGK